MPSGGNVFPSSLREGAVQHLLGGGVVVDSLSLSLFRSVKDADRISWVTCLVVEWPSNAIL